MDDHDDHAVDYTITMESPLVAAAATGYRYLYGIISNNFIYLKKFNTPGSKDPRG